MTVENYGKRLFHIYGELAELVLEMEAENAAVHIDESYRVATKSSILSINEATALIMNAGRDTYYRERSREALG